MASLFKIDDIVWSKVHRYSVTFYHRPCKVLKIVGSEMRVQVLDNGSTFVVDVLNFELVPYGGILEPGDELIHSETKEILIFTQYFDSDYIKCRNSDNEVRQYKIYDVERARRIFYV